ncbi:MAG: helix-turn-helix protein [Nocardioides sp.]|nr:helix-turn-helix protein [Nocardioides sp.]
MTEMPTGDSGPDRSELPDTFDARPGETVEVRRNAGLSAGIGAVASAVAIAYLARATGTGALLDWLLCLVMGAIAVAHLLAFVDARSPLLVADRQGVRIRSNRVWRGIAWDAIDAVEHLPAHGPWHDGSLNVVVDEDDVVAVRLSLSTRVIGAGGDLTAALSALAGDAAEVREALGHEHVADEFEDDKPGHLGVDAGTEEPLAAGPSAAARWHDPRPALALAIGAVSARLQRRAQPDPAVAVSPAEREAADEPTDPMPSFPLVASATPSPLRDPVVASRAEVRRDITFGATALRLDDNDDGSRRLPEARELRRPGSVNLIEDTVLWGDRVQPSAADGVETIVIDAAPLDLSTVEPAADPVIGPQLCAARTRIALTVDQLAERTRIRPHVIEAIEVDDFAPCGGDFYARGHVRTLARVLGIEAAPLLTSYDEKYADAPIDPRRVFEAELSTGGHGSIRGTRGGPNWSVLVAAVMALVLAWSIARLVMDSPVELHRDTPTLNGSRGIDNGVNTLLGDPVPVVLTAAGGGAQVLLRDGANKVVYKGPLAFGESRSFQVAPPVRVQTSDGSLVVTVDGEDRGPLGSTGQPAQDIFPVSAGR